MSFIAIDTETRGLDATQFEMGAIGFEDGKLLHFDSKEAMWDRIHIEAEKYRVRNRTLLIYAHNMQYDYYAIRGEKRPKEHVIYCHNPFIVDVRDEKGRVYAKFLSTTSFWKGKLSEIGDAMGYPKGETPQWLIDGIETPSWEERIKAKQYLAQDVKIVVEYVKSLKKMLKKANLNVRWMISASQIGINGLLKHMQLASNEYCFFSNKFKRELWRCFDENDIHKAIRGGRVQAIQVGEFENVTAIDINSHYPECFSSMEFPNLATQKIIEQPKKEDWYEKIGILECALKIKRNLTYGLLPIRINEKENGYPTKKGQILIGSWTIEEIKEAIKSEYELLYVHKAHTWEMTSNPITDYIHNLYKEKVNAKNEIEKHFIKIRLNGGIGKYAQRREDREYKWASVEEHFQMEQQGWEAVEAEGTERLYQRITGINYPKYYAPIIYAQVTAIARIKLWKYLLQCDPEKIYYTDTDCIIGDDDETKRGRFKYGNDLGEFKVEHEKENLSIKGKKAYMIGDKIALSGVGKLWLNADDFKSGKITYKRMETELTTRDKSKIGTFREIKSDLSETIKKSIEFQRKLNEMKMIVDVKNTITPFLKEVNKWTD